MGADASKPVGPTTDHVFTSSTPVSFSQQIVDGLQTSPETDRTRARDTELHVQQRVQAELKRLEEEQNKRIAERAEQASAAAARADEAAAEPSLKERVQQALMGDKEEPKKDLDREGVQREIDALRKKLSQRKLKEEVVNDKRVEKARNNIIECLRVNDRRPLDCWKEVEAFRREVGRLEGEFLGKVLE